MGRKFQEVRQKLDPIQKYLFRESFSVLDEDENIRGRNKDQSCTPPKQGK